MALDWIKKPMASGTAGSQIRVLISKFSTYIQKSCPKKIDIPYRICSGGMKPILQKSLAVVRDELFVFKSAQKQIASPKRLA